MEVPLRLSETCEEWTVRAPKSTPFQNLIVCSFAICCISNADEHLNIISLFFISDTMSEGLRFD